VSTLDLSTPPPNHKFSVSVEREESAGDRRVRLFKEVVLFLVAISFVLLIVGLCVSTLYSATATSDEKKWAMSVLSAAAGGIIGYLVKK
jgi:cytochrome c biogenesis protein CcdA